MTDRPILFSGPMVRAILEGRKTQTRRFLAPACDANNMPFVSVHHGLWKRGQNGIKVFMDRGDRLWVRETWAHIYDFLGQDPGVQARCDGGFYRADENAKDDEIRRWTPSIHMPRVASRITLIVKDIQAERLQDITEDDARAEGFKNVGAFADYWNSLTKTHQWHENPWVYVVKFRTVFENIDKIKTMRGAG